MLFLLFQQQNCIQKREQWFGERKTKEVQKKIIFTGKIYENDDGSVLEPTDYYSNIIDEHILNLIVEE